jgi:hypothetical protein
MMKRTLLTLTLATTFLSAGGDISPAYTSSCGGLYTYNYLPNSGVEHPCVDTGIDNGISGEVLLHKRVRYHASLYMDGGKLTEASQQVFDKILQTMAGGNYYVSIIGHTSYYEDDAHVVPLNGWSSFWQSFGGEKESTVQEEADEVNARIKTVYSALMQAGVSPSSVYTENRLARDPLATEATSAGRYLNERVDVAIYYQN